MEEVSCIFCKKQSREVFWEENGYTGRKCSQCGLIYLSPRPSVDEMAVLYDKGCSGGWTAKEHIAYSFFKELINKHTLSLIKKFKTHGDILEIGPGGGQFLACARENGFMPFAVEINKEQADYISNQLKIGTENVSAFSGDYFGSRKFDIVYHKDVLSHLHEPIKTFRILNSKLKEDGILVFETGNLGDCSKFWLSFLGRLGYPEHVYFFSIENVKELLNICGFKLIDYYCCGIVLHQLFSKILTRETSSDTKEANIINVKTPNFQKIKDVITYFSVYILGRMFPKNWPATVIYIVRKG